MSLSWPLALALIAPKWNDDPAPAVRVVAHDLDDQLAQVLALFEGTSAHDPAHWLASWRLATRNPDILSKTAQATIAALNPEMVRELAALDGATFRLDVEPDGALAWSLRLPRDDGTFAALASAMTLTDGGPESPLDPDGPPVDRLDRRGSFLSAPDGAALLFASSRPALGRARLDKAPDTTDAPPGLSIAVDPTRLAEANQSTLQRLGRALHGASLSSISARVHLESDTLHIHTQAKLPRESAPGAIDLAWLDTLPSDAPIAFTTVVDPDAIDLLAGLASAWLPEAEASPRARLAALALASGVALELDFWPLLRGASGFVLLDDQGQPRAAALALHARDEPAARRLADRILPRLIRALPGEGLGRGDLPSPSPPGGGPGRGATDSSQSAQVKEKKAIRPFGRPLTLSHRESSILLTWNPAALEASRLALDDPSHSLRHAPDLAPINLDRVALFARVQPAPLAVSRLSKDSPAVHAIQGSPPIVMIGDRGGDHLHMHITWSGFRDMVRRLVESTPQAEITNAP